MSKGEPTIVPETPQGPDGRSDGQRKIRSSRQLLLPEAQPPMSHLGVTLLRYVANTGLRYTLYQLGFPLPEVPPFHIVQLRLYFDVGKLEDLLAEQDGGDELIAALVSPGGSTEDSIRNRRLGGSAAFHRARLRLRSPRPRSKAGSATTPWTTFREQLSSWIPYLNELFLVEVLASLSRRRARGRGQPVAPAVGKAAHALLAKPSQVAQALPALGSADFLKASWSASEADRARREFHELVQEPLPLKGKGRGEFREGYRRALEALREPFLALATQAQADGIIEERDLAFFIPLDLAEDLSGAGPTEWVDSAAQTNRHEFESTHYQTTPPSQLSQGSRILGAAQPDPLWAVAALLPLP